jgi:NAD(P)-dependent dehydrogenase (short-subunit alcohol dehydrogenase family)
MTVSRVIHPCSPAVPFPYVDPADISHAVVYLSSDESRYVTGQQLFVDAGAGLKMGL